MVRPAGQAENPADLKRLLAIQNWVVDPAPQGQADLELLCRPGDGRFSRRADCRVLALFDEAWAKRFDTRQAHVVLSPSGTAGREDQIRLRLDDAAPLWAMLQGRDWHSQRAAA